MGSNYLLRSSLLGLPTIDEGVLDAIPLAVVGSIGDQSLLEVLLPLLRGDVDEVPSDGLLAGEVAQITEIICEQTSLPASGVKIVEKTPG